MRQRLAEMESTLFFACGSYTHPSELVGQPSVNGFPRSMSSAIHDTLQDFELWKRWATRLGKPVLRPEVDPCAAPPQGQPRSSEDRRDLPHAIEQVQVLFGRATNTLDQDKALALLLRLAKMQARIDAADADAAAAPTTAAASSSSAD